MKSPEDKLLITADPVQTFAPFDFVSAQSRLKPQGAGTTPTPIPASTQATRRPTLSLQPQPRYDSDPAPAIFLRELLTLAALAGMLWFQYEIIRCFW